MKKLAATLLLAARVSPALSFFRRQRREEPGAHGYRIRATGQRAVIRHDSDDPHVLAETFGRLAQYEPPAEVAAALAADPPQRIADLGGNVGLFGLLALSRFPGANLTSYEPDPGNAEILERVIELNGLSASWLPVRAAAAPAAGEMSFAAGRSSRSHQVDAGEEPAAITVPAIDVFGEIGIADLVKIDIEGGEWPLLADPRLDDLAAKVIVIEYHAAGCPGGDPRAAAIAAMQRAGYSVSTLHDRDPGDDPREGLGIAWGVRKSG